MVGVVLHERGDLSLAALVHYTGLAGKIVREALLVLLHHSLVLFKEGSATEDAQSETGAAPTLYRFDTTAALNRLGFPVILAAVKFEAFASESLLRLLFDIAVNGKFPVTGPDVDRAALDVLLREGLVEYVSDEMCRFNDSPSTDADADLSVASGKRKPPAAGPASAAKRSNSAHSTAQPLFVRLRVQNALFRYVVGAQIAQLAAKRINNPAAQLFLRIWQLAAREGVFSSASITSWTFSVTQLQPLVKGLDLPVDSTAAPGGIRASPLGTYLGRLCLELKDFMAPSQLTAMGSAYVINIADALNHIRFLQVEAFVTATYGRPSARCYRIIREQKMVEDRHIARLAMMPGKEVRERLFQLLKVGLVQLQEVPRTADHAPARTIFLWTIKHCLPVPQHCPSAYFQAFGSRLASALLNLRVLAHHERATNAALLEKVERTDVAGNLALLSDSEQQQLADLKKVLLVLGIKDSQIFSDFWTMTVGIQ